MVVIGFVITGTTPKEDTGEGPSSACKEDGRTALWVPRPDQHLVILAFCSYLLFALEINENIKSVFVC